MREIGVRELKESLSETLKAVSGGEQVRITRRGRPLADLVPAGEAAGTDQLRQLVAEGRVSLPSKPRPKRAPRLIADAPSASELVLSERDEER